MVISVVPRLASTAGPVTHKKAVIAERRVHSCPAIRTLQTKKSRLVASITCHAGRRKTAGKTQDKVHRFFDFLKAWISRRLAKCRRHFVGLLAAKKTRSVERVKP